MTKLASSEIELETAYKYQDFYGEWGMAGVRFIYPFLWIFPLIASILLIISFKRQNLTGSMQKCMILLVAFDCFFAITTGIKDAVFNALQWNYGYVEYKLCFFLLLFIRCQSIVHGTSLWIKISYAHSPSAHISISIITKIFEIQINFNSVIYFSFLCGCILFCCSIPDTNSKLCYSPTIYPGNAIRKNRSMHD